MHTDALSTSYPIVRFHTGVNVMASKNVTHLPSAVVMYRPSGVISMLVTGESVPSVVTMVLVRTSHTRMPLSSAHELMISVSSAVNCAVRICEGEPCITYGSASTLPKS